MYPKKGHCLDNNKCTLLNAFISHPKRQTLDSQVFYFKGLPTVCWVNNMSALNII